MLKYQLNKSIFGKTANYPDISFVLKRFKNYSTDDYSTTDYDGASLPPMACSFAKQPAKQHVLSVVDEEGVLVLYDTRKSGSQSVLANWQTHGNAVFDVEWMQEESKLLTASGDQTVKLWDVERSEIITSFEAHTGSVKSVSFRQADDAVFVSGSRDGQIKIWDKRKNIADGMAKPIDTIRNAHFESAKPVFVKTRRKRQLNPLKDNQQSVTVVVFQNEHYIISSGAVDGKIKVWDLRRTYKSSSCPVPVFTFTYPGNSTRKHGYSSLALNHTRTSLFANCTDDVIYQYCMSSFSNKPEKTYRGHKNSTFYIKSCVSPDDQYLLSGSTTEDAFIWQVNKSEAPPVLLNGHAAEVTGVAWCPNDFTKIVTLSDDAKTKFWRLFCREMKKTSLPAFTGKAKIMTKEKGTTMNYSEKCMEVKPLTKSVSDPTPTAKPLTRSTSLKEWLKRKQTLTAPEPEIPTKKKLIEHQETVKGKKRLLEDERNDSPEPKKLKTESESRLQNCSPNKLSPRKRKLADAVDENGLPQSKRKLSESPISPPTRPCLTNLSNEQKVERSNVRTCLFSKETDTNTNKISELPFSNYVEKVKSNSSKIDESSTNSSDFVTPCKNINRSLIYSELEDFSPTRNLPNLVLDRQNTSPSVSHSRVVCRTPKRDWLTRMKQERRLSCDSSPKYDSSPSPSPTPSPSNKLLKPLKGMRAITSFFKTREDTSTS